MEAFALALSSLFSYLLPVLLIITADLVAQLLLPLLLSPGRSLATLRGDPGSVDSGGALVHVAGPRVVYHLPRQVGRRRWTPCQCVYRPG